MYVLHVDRGCLDHKVDDVVCKSHKKAKFDDDKRVGLEVDIVEVCNKSLSHGKDIDHIIDDVVSTFNILIDYLST